MTSAFWISVAGIFGLLVGSFLNVCIFRLPRNCMSIVRPRSRCSGCLKMIAWYDNIPVLSWLVLRGRCRGCGAGISARYPAVELLTALAFVGTAGYVREVHAGEAGVGMGVTFVILAYLVATMIVSTFIDFDFQILPDEITLSGIVLGLAVCTAYPDWTLRWGDPLPDVPGGRRVAALLLSAVGALAGGGVIYGVGVLGRIVFRKEAMGLGDVKYMAFLGAFIGWQAILLSFFIACVAGGLFGIGKFIVVRRMGYVPFGPFLSVGVAVMLFGSGLVYDLMQRYFELVRGR